MRPLPLLRITTRPFEDLATLAAPRSTELLDQEADHRRDLDRLAQELSDALFAAAGPPDPEADPDAARTRLTVVALRRAVFNRRRLAEKDLAAAAPHLDPGLLRRLEDYTARQWELELLAQRCASTFLGELESARRGLLAAAREPTFQAAMRLVSRSLLEDLRRLGPPSSWRHDQRLTAARLTAYLGRAATKTSPNGLFCATSLAGWAEGGSPAAATGENRPHRLEVLLNVTEARKIAACLGADEAIWPALVPRVNPTLQEAEEGWTFWRPASLRRDDSDEVLRRLRRQPVAEHFLRFAAAGELRVPELLAKVAEATGVLTEHLAAFFRRLTEAGLLTGEIEIPYTCRRPLVFLARAVGEAGCQPPWLAEVEAVEEGVAGLADLDPLERNRVMDSLEEHLQTLPHHRPLAGDELFRVDAASALTVTLPAEMLDELSRAVGGYARLFASLYPGDLLRRHLARSFLARFEADREIPLLDVYRGLELRDPDGARPSAFPTPPGTPDGGSPEGSLERARRFFAERAAAAAAAGEGEVRLSEEDWQLVSGGVAEPRWAAGVLFQVTAKGPAELAAGRYRLVLSDLYTGVGVALARFAHLHAPAEPTTANPIVAELARASRRFGRPGAILAEVTFNHWGRTANAGLRIPFLEHEIELLGERASPGARVLPLQELTLRWASGEGRFVLSWPRQGLEVVPVISSGVRPEGFVSLLAAVGRQAIQPLSYFPGFEAEGVVRWPRFAHGRVVVFRRRWIFAPGTAPEPPAESGSPDRLLADFFARVHRWRRREELPRHLFVHTSRERKPFHVDLASPLFVDLLRRLLVPPTGEPPPTLYATEMLPGPDDLWVGDRRGRYATELLVQMEGGWGPLFST